MRARARSGVPLVAWVVVLVLAAGAGAYGTLVEPRWVEVTRHEIGTPSRGARSLRVAQVSDLHMSSIGDRERRVLEILRAEQPDLVVFTGDFIDSRAGVRAVPEFLKLVQPKRTMLGVPGNWDHGFPLQPIADALAAEGGSLLVNAAVRLPSGPVIVGIDDFTAGHPDAATACAAAAGAKDVLVLTHSPELRDVTALCAGAVAMLAGHTHGGQVTFAGWAPVRPPGSGDYVAGWYRGQPVDLYVSRGIGTTLLPVRFGSRPEVAIFTWWLTE